MTLLKDLNESTSAMEFNLSVEGKQLSVDEVAEWLRRWTANPLGSASVGSNPILVDEF